MSKSCLDILAKKFPDKVNISNEESILYISAIDSWYDIAEFIFNDKNLKFDYLMCITSYDLSESGKFGLAYNFHSTTLKHSLEVRIEFEHNVKIKSIEPIWKAADWHEREAYDLMGILFKDHPEMKRILLPQDWEGHPLRKNYKTPEYYNGMPVPKDKSYWE